MFSIRYARHHVYDIEQRRTARRIFVDGLRLKYLHATTPLATGGGKQSAQQELAHAATRATHKRGEAAKQVANIYAASAISAAKRLRKGIGALTTEFSTRLRRTPLLLPIRRFGSDHLVTLLSSTGEAIKGDHVPSDVIKDACLDFERKHPYAKAGMRQGRFENLAGVEFVAPGRADHHGRRALKVGNGHNEACYLNARLRLGGAFADGFHYDCTRQRRAYSGIFGNCHDAEASYTGRPHLNVYPNDFIR